VIVDEIGPLELEGRGVWAALEECFRRPPRKLVLTIREPLVEAFLGRFPGGPPDIFRADDPAAASRILG
jgi:nucleoside-triphosphatase THEP1